MRADWDLVIERRRHTNHESPTPSRLQHQTSNVGRMPLPLERLPNGGVKEETTRPFVDVKLVEGILGSEEEHARAAALTDVMVRFDASEAFRKLVWRLIEELHPDSWHLCRRPF